MPMTLSSSAFKTDGFFPVKYTALGDNVSPPLQWEDAPAGTRSFAMIFDALDPSDGRWIHWLLYDLPPDLRDLEEHVPPQPTLASGPKRGLHARQGRNDFGKIGYSGPVGCRDRPLRYAFTLYALDSALHVSSGAGKGDLLGAMHNHILGQCELVGRFSE